MKGTSSLTTNCSRKRMEWKKEENIFTHTFYWSDQYCIEVLAEDSYLLRSAKTLKKLGFFGSLEDAKADAEARKALLLKKL